MREALEGLLRRVLQIPPDPEPPLGAPDSVRVFRAAPGFYRYRLLVWGLQQLGVVFGFVAFLVFLHFVRDWPLSRMFSVLEALGIVFFLVQLPFSFLVIALDYKYRWYMISDRSLRVREGLFKVQERTMTFSNIQNVSIRQGPVQRFFGISDLQVRTAGGGGASASGDNHRSKAENLHLGYFRGVANAPEIRDKILEHLRRLRTSGLGNPDEAADAHLPAAGGDSAGPNGTGGNELLTAAEEVLAATRALNGLVS